MSSASVTGKTTEQIRRYVAESNKIGAHERIYDDTG
jgi:hypothetical protein